MLDGNGTTTFISPIEVGSLKHKQTIYNVHLDNLYLLGGCIYLDIEVKYPTLPRIYLIVTYKKPN